MTRVLCLALFIAVAAVSLRKDPKGAGIAEDTKDLACSECAKHKDYLDSQDECVCFASDIMGTFENDATKTSTKRVGSSGDGSGSGTHSFKDETSNIGAARLPA